MPKNKGFYRQNEGKIQYRGDIGDPGTYPFTRGLYPQMYRKRKPTIREFAGHGLAPDTNERFLLILQQGGTGLSTAFDLPTLMGRDSDDPLCEGQVGWDGVAIDTLADMEELFANIPVDEVTVSMTINAPAAVIWAMYLAMAQKQGIPFERLGGTIQNDILKEYIAQKEWLFPEEYGVGLVVDTIEYAARHVPKWHPVSISGYHIREAGATAIQEVAYTLSSGIEYVRKSLERGLSVDAFAPQLSFFFDIHNNFLEEIAKLRAARRLWARIMHDRFGSTNPRSQWCRMHVQTAGCTLTRHEPLNNLIRVTIQALAGMFGGAQSVHTNSYDEVLCTPTEEAVKLAIRTQQIIQEETGICEFPDPFGGSYLIEQTTNEIEQEAEDEIDRIEDMGGMIEAAKQGDPQGMIRFSASRYEQAVEAGEVLIVGVNMSSQGEVEEPVGVAEELEARRGFEKRQITRLKNIKQSRDSQRVSEVLDEIRSAAERGANMMPSLIQAVSVYATLGEICDALKDVWGEYKEREMFVAPPHAAAMEAAVRRYQLVYPLRILIAKGGLDGHDRIIHTLAEFYKDLGAEVIYPGLHCSMKEIAKRAMEEDVDVVAISTHIGSPVVFFQRLHEHLHTFGKDDIRIIGGGVIRSRELEELHKFGVAYFAPVGTSFEAIAQFLCKEAQRHENEQ
ncbi:methylmalonyl-CoA mutase family protein [Patescibacteria group bacterium AH-259-L07]|nr:methylmalonyl-CoA mutase family protein [Patescibacteria group bacterium AH-259-L07]